MFCTKCGASIDDKAAFCPNCGMGRGNAVAVQGGGAAVAYAPQEKEQLLRQMEGSFGVMTAMKQKEGEIDMLEAQLPKLEKKASKTTRNIMIIAGIILWSMFSSSIHKSGDATVDFIIRCLFSWPILLVPIAIIRYTSASKKIAALQQQIQGKRNEMEFMKQDASLNWLPYDYRDPTYFAMMYGYIRNMRARNLTEAINLLETEMHRARVELASQISAMAASDAASSAGSAAAGAAASAFFSLFR